MIEIVEAHRKKFPTKQGLDYRDRLKLGNYHPDSKRRLRHLYHHKTLPTSAREQ